VGVVNVRRADEGEEEDRESGGDERSQGPMFLAPDRPAVK